MTDCKSRITDNGQTEATQFPFSAGIALSPKTTAYRLSENKLRDLRSLQAIESGMIKPTQLKLLSKLCFVLGFASIIGSIAIWFLAGGQAADTQGHAERFGIFVGLWAPTFFILSNCFDHWFEKSV